MKLTKQRLIWWVVYSVLLVAFSATPSYWDLLVLPLLLWWVIRDFPNKKETLRWTRPQEYPNDCIWVAEPMKGVEYAVYDGGSGGVEWKAFITLGTGQPQLVGSPEPTAEKEAKVRCEKHWKSYPR